MNRKEYLLTCLIEECAEIQKHATKAQRFGMGSSYKDACTNGEGIVLESHDVLAVLEMMHDEGMIMWDSEDLSLKLLKKLKVEEYMKFSIKQGTLNE